jgi:hypothetical protein
MNELELMGFKTQIVKTNYEFQQGANEMLLVYTGIKI